MATIFRSGFGQGMEWAIRPFAGRDAAIQRLVDRRPPEADGSAANIRWGKPSGFGFSPGGFGIVTTTVIYPTPDPDDPDSVPEDITLDFTEVSREETDEIRIENPDDEDQYVMVKDVTVIVFEGPDIRPDSMVGDEGRQTKIFYRYTFTPPSEE